MKHAEKVIDYERGELVWLSVGVGYHIAVIVRTYFNSHGHEVADLLDTTTSMPQLAVPIILLSRKQRLTIMYNAAE